MAHGKKPGTLCVTHSTDTIDDGTLCRHHSSSPVPLGATLHELSSMGSAAVEWLLAETRLTAHMLWVAGSKSAAKSLGTGLLEQSGGHWVSQFPTSKNIDDLTAPFRNHVKHFVGSLHEARASVKIAATLRPPQRAYLMHFSFAIAREGANPQAVPSMAGVNIKWGHTNVAGKLDLKASRHAAEDMVQGFGIVYKPALTSRHSEGKAIDMKITWKDSLTVIDGKGNKVTITTTPRNGAGNTQLHEVGKSFGVIKLLSDKPHWSLDGH